MATRIAIACEKGGVGKTTATIEIAANLKLLGKRVLAIDFDYQGDLTKNINGVFDDKNIFEVLNGEIHPQNCIQRLEAFDLIASSFKLSKASKVFVERDDIFLLDEAINLIEENYDYILIDNNPDLSDLFLMSMIAADYVIIPTKGDESSFKNLLKTEEVLNQFTSGRQKVSHAEVMGYIFSGIKKRASIHTVILEKLNELAESKDTDVKPFVRCIPDTVKMDEIKTYKTPISLLQKGCTQAREFYSIAQEIIERSEREVV